MPLAAPRPCSMVGCGVLVRDGSGRCPSHPRAVWAKPKPTKRITGRRLQAMRARLFERNPFCATCKALGFIKAATQRDHVVSLEEGGADDESNEQGLCDDCHATKSQAEAQRGRARTAWTGGGE